MSTSSILFWLFPSRVKQLGHEAGKLEPFYSSGPHVSSSKQRTLPQKSDFYIEQKFRKLSINHNLQGKFEEITIVKFSFRNKRKNFHVFSPQPIYTD
jgi:hypothetical protein